jgi:hypothetical protein
LARQLDATSRRRPCGFASDAQLPAGSLSHDDYEY